MAGKKKVVIDDTVLDLDVKVDNTADTLQKLSEATPTELIPARTDSDWHNYVMKQFHAEELQDNKPKVDGLRRIVRLLVGEIIESEVKPVVVEREYACVTTKVVVKRADGVIFTYQEIANVETGNTDPEYLRHAPGTAATRAEGRALRKLLGLRTISHEESSSAPPNLVPNEPNPDKINESQINILKVLCSRNGLSLKNFVNSGQYKYEKLELIPFEVAQKMIPHLSDCISKNKIESVWLDNSGENWNK